MDLHTDSINSIIEEIVGKYNKNDKVKMTKELRERTGLGLKEASDAIERRLKGESPNKYSESKNSFYEELSRLPGFDAWGTKKEIKHLKTMLKENEDVYAVASGLMENNTWLIACTSKRVIFVDCGMIYGVRHSEIMIDKINSISFKNGILLGEIHIEDGASTRIIKNVQKYSTKPFVDAVHRAMENAKRNNLIIQNNEISVADELMKFKKLLDIGAITEDEYNIQKERLLK